MVKGFRTYHLISKIKSSDPTEKKIETLVTFVIIQFRFDAIKYQWIS